MGSASFATAPCGLSAPRRAAFPWRSRPTAPAPAPPRSSGVLAQNIPSAAVAGAVRHQCLVARAAAVALLDGEPRIVVCGRAPPASAAAGDVAAGEQQGDRPARRWLGLPPEVPARMGRERHLVCPARRCRRSRCRRHPPAAPGTAARMRRAGRRDRRGSLPGSCAASAPPQVPEIRSLVPLPAYDRRSADSGSRGGGMLFAHPAVHGEGKERAQPRRVRIIGIGAQAAQRPLEGRSTRQGGIVTNR